MRKSPHLILLLFFFLYLFSTAGAEASQKSADTSRVSSLVEEFRKLADIPGMAVAIGRSDSILWEQGFGLSDIEKNVPATPKTKFRLGSVSKIITIGAAMRLVDRGVLDLDAPIAKYVSSLPEQYGKLTVRQLAGHLAGVRHYKREDFELDTEHFDSVKDSLKVFINDPLIHEPGTKYLYSTFGYVLLSAVLEGASGKDFLTLLQEEVTQPIRLNGMSPDFVRQIIPDKTSYYEREKGKLLNAPYEDPSYKWAAGGMISTVGDLARFGMAHLRPGYLKQESLDAMFASQKTADGKETGVGLGWRIGSDWRGRKIYHHAGNISGARAVLILYPETGYVIALETNVSGQPAFVESTAQMIAERFFSDGAKELSMMDKDLIGKHELSGKNADKTYTAALELRHEKDAYKGSISGSFPLLDAAKKNGLPENLIVSAVWMKDTTPALILSSPFGMLEMLLQRDGDGYRYVVEEGPAKFEGVMMQ